MRAVEYHRYGPPHEVLETVERPDPFPTAGEVLVGVAATSINLSDWECLLGSPFYARIGGVRRPAVSVLGSDIAGRVIAVGDGVTEFSAGDLVYGDNLFRKGGFAELAIAPVDVLALVPDGLTASQAACVPQPGPIAVQGTEGIRRGEEVLINGGGGGSGSLAIQLAAQAGAHVTAVDNAEKLDHMRSMGAETVIDYRTTDFTRTGHRYDHILDLVAHRSVFALLRSLAPGGRYWCVGGSALTLLAIGTIGNFLARATGRRMGVLAVRGGPDRFDPVAREIASGRLRLPIDRVFRLDEVPDALAHVGEGHSLGKVVIEIEREDMT